ncbi:hypothetical protein CY35_01G050400 [Sphagnum magellanicum]|nr:hypothetical protein CY35_01G050400 [Sphagnum magellanicum]
MQWRNLVPGLCRFHALSDFDEEKRSCRQKLERHNNRRRRKVQEFGEDTTTITIDNDNPSLEEGKDGKFMVEEKATVDSEVQSDADQSCSLVAPTIPLLVEQLKTTDEAHPSLPNPNASNTMSPKEQSVEKGEVGVRKVGVDEDSLLALQLEEAPDEVNPLPHMSDLPTVISTREHDRSSTYTARYPSGQISFKLYDWNPGDFPRNLRQQILEWLSNMPVELEGYIRSGCTILTLFIAMPQSMWDELYVDWAGAVRKLVQGPQSVAGFWDQGYFKAKLGWKTVHFVDGQLVNRSGGKEECMPCMPVLKSVQPICFEAASEGQLTVSGENLLQPNTRLLVSAGGKYLNAHVVQSCHENEEDEWKIIIPALDCSQVGPLFIEVENEGRTSNSMTVLVGDRNLCSELERLELEVSRGCEQDLVFDLCWMLRDSSCQDSGACSRLQDLFLYAKACGWHSLAEYVLQAAGRKGMLPEVTKVGDKTYPFRGDMDAPQALMVLPTMVLEWNNAHLLPPFKKDRKFGKKDVHITVDSGRDTLVPLIPKQRRGSCNQSWGTYRVMAAVATVTVVCAGVCLVLVHPNEVIQLSTSLHHRLWGQ